MGTYVAIVGAGPAGFYAAERLLQLDQDIQVHVFDRLPTPFGLVRSGIAPDHPNTKRVTVVFDKIGRHPRFRFFGNVVLGRTVSLAEIRSAYHSVIFAHGAAADRRLGIAGEDFGNCIPASAFVGWYNGHPSYAQVDPDLSVDTALIIGNGNVAADIARVLLSDPEKLGRTDIADHALRKITDTKLHTVHIVGRRGSRDAKMGLIELKELASLAGVSPVIDDPVELAGAETPTAAQAAMRCFPSAASERRKIIFHFNLVPHRVIGIPGVAGVVFIDRLGQKVTIPAGLVIKSIGNLTTPIDGMPQHPDHIQVPNSGGRVVTATGEAIPGLYVVGWAKRGANGTVGVNRSDAHETCDYLLADLQRDSLQRDPEIFLRNLFTRGTVTDYAGWQRIDQAEIEAGRGRKPREKIVSFNDLVSAAAPFAYDKSEGPSLDTMP